jgi:4-amino-4-deoxy-L-arabinose transferase-like glycosyltransferase
MDNIKLFWRKNYHYLLPILVGLGLRILWGIAVPINPTDDSNAYDTFAKNIADNQVYSWDGVNPTAFWPPGTSFFYSLFYRVFGHNYWPIAIFNCSLSVVIMMFTMLLAEFWFGVGIATYTGWILALWPALIQYVSLLASELIFIAFTMSALWFWYTKKLRWNWQGIITGILLAIATYVRTTAAVIPIVLCFSSIITVPKERIKTVKATVLSIILIAMLTAPWSYRNTQAFGRPTTLATNSGANFWMGNNPKSTGGYMPLPPDVDNMNEAERNDYLKEKAISHIKQFPLLYLKRCIQRTIMTYDRQTISIVWNQKTLKNRYGNLTISFLKILNQVYWLVVLGLSISGLVLFVLRSGLWTGLTHPVVLFWGYFSFLCTAIVGSDRYLYPALTLIAIMAGYGLFQLRNLKSTAFSR